MPEQYILYQKNIVLYSVTLNISAVLQQHKYEEIDIDDPESEGFYVLSFTSTSYIIQYSLLVNGDTITEKALVFDEK